MEKRIKKSWYVKRKVDTVPASVTFNCSCYYCYYCWKKRKILIRKYFLFFSSTVFATRYFRKFVQSVFLEQKNGLWYQWCLWCLRLSFALCREQYNDIEAVRFGVQITKFFQSVLAGKFEHRTFQTNIYMKTKLHAPSRTVYWALSMSR